MNDKKVVFRRVRGRIVPIRVEAKDVAVTGGLVGAGVGVAVAAGRGAANLVREAADIENAARTALKASRFKFHQARSLGPLFERPAALAHAKAGHQVLKSMAKARAAYAGAMKLRNYGFLAGSALVGAGINRALEKTDLHDDPVARAAISSVPVAAAVTSFAMRSSYLRGIRGKSIKISAALIQAAKATLKAGL